ncbi:amidohydrolase family protein [Streptomyces sp. NPDC014622]|uniref:amidohydrolase family protein n=1 Tax=Streptomyces sp. NPDC014622 TaxID=3364874 RepID=UPI0036F4D04B
MGGERGAVGAGPGRQGEQPAAAPRRAHRDRAARTRRPVRLARGHRLDAAAGRIAPGYRADLTALGVDPVEAPADELGEAPVRLTVCGGRVAHRG